MGSGCLPTPATSLGILLELGSTTKLDVEEVPIRGREKDMLGLNVIHLDLLDFVSLELIDVWGCRLKGLLTRRNHFSGV